jgi:hypothetical protein
MDDRVSRRLAELRAEYDAGQRAMAELETRRTALRDTLLRISGAIQVLEEVATDTPAAPAPGAADDEASDGTGRRRPGQATA